MRYLFDDWKGVAARLRSAEHVLLLFDYDGTLTPIANSPDTARLDEETRELVRKLTDDPHYRVAIISGRSLGDLKDMVKLINVTYAGNHGLEIERDRETFVNPVAEEFAPTLKTISKALSSAYSDIPGVLIEDKGLTLSVHYRLVADNDLHTVHRIFDTCVSPLESAGQVRITQGKMVHEIRPLVDWDKGKAVSWLLERIEVNGTRKTVLPLYAGDDTTDEDGFRVVGGVGGISIFVGDEHADSQAQYYLRSTDEVKELLKRIQQVSV